MRHLKSAAAVGLAAALCIPTAVANADDVSNNLDDAVDAVAEIMPLNVGGRNGSTELYITPANNDGKNGCNLTADTTLTLAISSSNSAVATVSPGSVTFTACSDRHALTVTPVSQGFATVSASQTSNTTAGTFNLAPVTFSVNVAAPANTAPRVGVAGVTGGASYAKGSVPTATCQVTDAEDGNRSFPATLSELTGDYASDGIGSQTASCSYTDRGGLTASASETYGIADPSAPSVSYTLNPADPDGLNGWYTSDVVLDWTVAEADSPNSLQRTGCEDRTISVDQLATAYTCVATSAGGRTERGTVAIKRDATAPEVTAAARRTAEYNDGTTNWFKDYVTVGYAASDAEPGSGLVGAASGSETRTISGSYFTKVDDHAGNSTTSNVVAFKVDAKAPEVQASILSQPAFVNGDDTWFKNSVDVGYQASDEAGGSGLATPPSGGDTKTASGEYSVVAKDNVGHETTSNTLSFQVDAAAPVISVTCPPSAVRARSTATATWTATDSGSGVAGTASGSVTLDTSSIGTKTATVLAGAASDNVGHTSAAATCGYSVVYDFKGFFAPIDNNGVFNGAKAGSAIPVKFSLGGDMGLGVLTPSTSTSPNPSSTKITCPSGVSVDTVEELSTATTSGLKYDAVAEQYNYTWKTATTFAGTCQKLSVKYLDGTQQVAYFTFTK